MARALMLATLAGLIYGCSMNGGSAGTPADHFGSDSARTVFAALGSGGPFTDYTEAEREVGWRILRSEGGEWDSPGGGGIIETFPEVGLPQIRVQYSMRSKDLGVTRLVQAPQPYVPQGDGSLEEATIGPWGGQWYQSDSQVGFVFATGESASGRQVVAHAFVQLKYYTADEFRAFIASLTFGD